MQKGKPTSSRSRYRRKSNDIQVRIAEYLLGLDQGDSLQNVRELAKQFDVSVGTISNAIHDLEKTGVVEIERRGHLGSYLSSKLLGGLWSIIQDGPLVIAFTIPSNLRFEGLATGLKMLLDENSIQTYLIFIRGSSTRLRALREDRCNAVVMSRLTADGECGNSEEVAMELPSGSWLTENRIYFRKGINPNKTPLRVGVDPDSYDHKFIIDLEFQGKHIEKVERNFTQLPRLLFEGQIDTTVWNAEEVRLSGQEAILSRPLASDVLEELDERDVSATIAIRRDTKFVKTILAKTIDPERIMDIQAKVISGEMLPEY